jgi:Integrase core domain
LGQNAPAGTLKETPEDWQIVNESLVHPPPPLAVAACRLLTRRSLTERSLMPMRGRTVASMSRTGNCYDNAMVESFWGKLNTEMVYHQHFTTKAEARAAVFEYIEMFYNRRRLHAALNCLSPEAFENRRVS